MLKHYLDFKQRDNTNILTHIVFGLLFLFGCRRVYQIPSKKSLKPIFFILIFEFILSQSRLSFLFTLYIFEINILNYLMWLEKVGINLLVSNVFQ